MAFTTPIEILHRPISIMLYFQ